MTNYGLQKAAGHLYDVTHRFDLQHEVELCDAAQFVCSDTCWELKKNVLLEMNCQEKRRSVLNISPWTGDLLSNVAEEMLWTNM